MSSHSAPRREAGEPLAGDEQHAARAPRVRTGGLEQRDQDGLVVVGGHLADRFDPHDTVG